MPNKDPEKRREFARRYREEHKDEIRLHQEKYKLSGKTKEYRKNYKQKYGELTPIKYRINQKRRIFEKNKPKLLRQYRVFETLLGDEVFNGLMLSDAHLTKPVYKNSRFDLGQTYRNKDLVLSTQEHFADLGISCSVKLMLKEEPKQHVFYLYTKYCKAFSMLRKIWYPEGKKIIPSFIKITPKLLSYYFMGDGTSSWEGKSASRVLLYTLAFPLNDTKRFSDMLRELQIDNRIQKKGEKNQFYIDIRKVDSIERFYDVVEPYILPCFRYKIKRHKIDGRHLTIGIHKSPKTEFKKGHMPWNKDGKRY